MRADLFLVEHGFARSRAEAQAAIAAGNVFQDGKAVRKASQRLDDPGRIAYAPAHSYVSRGALKLGPALERFGVSPKGRLCLDLGASTGGFTEILLERGARQVIAVDVGHGQLAPRIAADPRVVALERINARDLGPMQLPSAPDAVVADLSFISLKLALPPALALAAVGAWLVVLVKPQFEVGRARIGKGGIVRDEGAWRDAVDGVSNWLADQPGWSVLGAMESTIEGGDGNREFLVAAIKA
jgi:23S rRNA (cytidine1920-2'-O)/16S rRNA (cytidine1409-2'-O)-methyltransferase